MVEPQAEQRTIRLTVNGKQYEGRAEPRTNLADFLRHELLLTGTHVGCEHGVCGACTELRRDNPRPTEAQVRDVLTGNLCRCTGYSGIVEAALAASRTLAGEG